MKKGPVVLPLLVCGILLVQATAQVPQIISYRSSLTVRDRPYHGVGQFKFAFIDREGARSYWSHDGSSQNASEPRTAIAIPVLEGVYEVLLGDTSLTHMTPVPSSVFSNAGVHIRVWFSDGQSPFETVQPDQPVTAVGYAMMAAGVAEGSVTSTQLADGAVTAQKLAPRAVTAASITPASINATHLAPNTALESLGASGALALSDQANAVNLLETGFQKLGTVISEADSWLTNETYCPGPRAGHFAVWTGQEMILWGGATATGVSASKRSERSGGRYHLGNSSWVAMATNGGPIPALAAGNGGAVWAGDEMIVLSGSPRAGGIYSPYSNTWRTMTMSNAPADLLGATYAWTGTELIVWGMQGGRRYRPASDQWQALSNSNAPAGCRYHSAVWTGQEMIIWGGQAAPGVINKGARYDPALDAWRPLSQADAPSARTGHTAVWASGKMIIWGGQTSSGVPLATGGIYLGNSDSWQAVPTNGAPQGRKWHSACWTGREMIVYGGIGTNYVVNRIQPVAWANGARFNPVSGVWTAISNPPFPEFVGQSAVWTGTDMIVWGGGSPNAALGQTLPPEAVGPCLNSGSRYDPATDRWRPLPTAPVGRVGHTLVWTDKELIVWGGSISENSRYSTDYLGSGARMNLVTRQWLPISGRNAPTPRRDHKAVWTGKEMIVWGGLGVNTNLIVTSMASILNTGARYNPVMDTWSPMDTNGVPTARYGFTWTWTGRDVVLFGGTETAPTRSLVTASGGRYDPQTDSWATLAGFNAPTARRFHSACWAGQELIIWGGEGFSAPGVSTLSMLASGGRYDPASNTWRPMTTNAFSRTNHTAVWTGEQMIVFGGQGGKVVPEGARYEPATDRWDSMARGVTIVSPSPAVAWTGSELIVLGNQSGRYNPLTDAWVWLSQPVPSQGWRGHQAIWAGQQLLVFGGIQANALPSALLQYGRAKPLYLYRHP